LAPASEELVVVVVAVDDDALLCNDVGLPLVDVALCVAAAVVDDVFLAPLKSMGFPSLSVMTNALRARGAGAGAEACDCCGAPPAG